MRRLLRTSDPLRDFDRWDEEQEEALEKLPICEECKEHIQDDYVWEIEGELLHEDCAKAKYRKPIDGFIERRQQC